MNTRPTVVVTRPLPGPGLETLRREYEVQVHDLDPSRSLDVDTLIEWGREADALITLLSDPVTEDVFAACPHLKIVAQYAVGYDNIDLAAARAHDVTVTHTPDVLTDATADFTWALLLAAARRLRAADQHVREGRFQRWETSLLLGMELRGKTLGIVGMGRIGSAVARRALGFGMDVIYHNRRRANPTVERELSARYVSMETLLTESDVVSLHCALNADSHHLLDAEAFQAMKPTALLVNTARGAVIDEAALARALEQEEIAGAALDVFEEEPDVHPGLLEQERVVLAPHLGSATVEARTKMAEMCAEAVSAALEGEADDVPYRIA